MSKKARVPYGYSDDVTKRLIEGMGCPSSFFPGWKDIIDSTNEKLAALHPDYTIDQIKTKFNWACFYASGVTSEEGKKILSDLNRELSKTCIKCGQDKILCSKYGHKEEADND